jgi:transcriptional regulator with XRE-family HTH domain
LLDLLQEIILLKYLTPLRGEGAMTGLELKLKRIKAGLKQYEVAAQVGISANRLCEIELGRRKGPPDLLARINEALELNKLRKGD